MGDFLAAPLPENSTSGGAFDMEFHRLVGNDHAIQF